MKLVFKYIVMHLKSQLEYKSSFILSFLAQLLPTTLSACMVFILIDRFNFGNKFDVYEVMLGIAIVQFGFGFSQMMGRGFDKFSEIIKRGDLDLMLIRPRNIYLQIFGSDIEFTKLSRVIGGLVLFIVAIINAVNLIDGLEYEPSRTDDIIANFENLGKTEGPVKCLKQNKKNN